jgi:hypothetical protein
MQPRAWREMQGGDVFAGAALTLTTEAEGGAVGKGPSAATALGGVIFQAVTKAGVGALTEVQAGDAGGGADFFTAFKVIGEEAVLKGELGEVVKGIGEGGQFVSEEGGLAAIDHEMNEFAHVGIDRVTGV